MATDSTIGKTGVKITADLSELKPGLDKMKAQVEAATKDAGKRAAKSLSFGDLLTSGEFEAELKKIQNKAAEWAKGKKLSPSLSLGGVAKTGAGIMGAASMFTGAYQGGLPGIVEAGKSIPILGQVVSWVENIADKWMHVKENIAAATHNIELQNQAAGAMYAAAKQRQDQLVSTQRQTTNIRGATGLIGLYGLEAQTGSVSESARQQKAAIEEERRQTKLRNDDLIRAAGERAGQQKITKDQINAEIKKKVGSTRYYAGEYNYGKEEGLAEQKIKARNVNAAMDTERQRTQNAMVGQEAAWSKQIAAIDDNAAKQRLEAKRVHGERMLSMDLTTDAKSFAHAKQFRESELLQLGAAFKAQMATADEGTKKRLKKQYDADRSLVNQKFDEQRYDTQLTAQEDYQEQSLVSAHKFREKDVAALQFSYDEKIKMLRRMGPEYAGVAADTEKARNLAMANLRREQARQETEALTVTNTQIASSILRTQKRPFEASVLEMKAGMEAQIRDLEHRGLTKQADAMRTLKSVRTAEMARDYADRMSTTSFAQLGQGEVFSGKGVEAARRINMVRANAMIGEVSTGAINTTSLSKDTIEALTQAFAAAVSQSNAKAA